MQMARGLARDARGTVGLCLHRQKLGGVAAKSRWPPARRYAGREGSEVAKLGERSWPSQTSAGHHPNRRERPDNRKRRSLR